MKKYIIVYMIDGYVKHIFTKADTMEKAINAIYWKENISPSYEDVSIVRIKIIHEQQHTTQRNTKGKGKER